MQGNTEVAGEPGSFLIEGINCEALETMVYARRYDDAVNQLLRVIHLMKRGAGFTFYGEAPPIEALYSRLASAIAALIADPQFALSHEGFVRLISEHSTLHSIFRASVYQNADFVLSLVGARAPDDARRIQFGGDAVPKLLLMWSLESEIDLPFESMAVETPQWVTPAMVGYLAIGGVHNEKAYARKCAIMRLSRLLEAAPFHEAMIPAAGDAYMHCSYVDIPEKHEVKKVLNRQLRRLIDVRMKVNERFTLVPKDRPRILVPIEWFGSHHAMYRCYARAIKQLRERFEVIGCVRPEEIDEVGRAAFDSVIELSSQNIGIDEIIKAVESVEPDMIFYPSVGMAAWWVALSNFRLAPVQIMCPGHPATTHSAAIDYIVSDGDLFGDERHYSEKCIHLPIGGARYTGREFDLTGVERPNDGVVRLAVPAMVMKLIPPFLAAVQRIARDSPVPVEVQFFSNQVATGQFLVERDLRRWVPGAVVWPRSDYQTYMANLSKCDLMLSTFPFGGTNSTMDAFLCGVPVLTLEGDQIHSRSDASMIRRIGGPRAMITRRVDDYVDTARSLIRGWCRPPMSVLRDDLLKSDVRAEFYGDGPPHVQGAFRDAFVAIYERALHGQAARVSDGARWGAGDGPEHIQRRVPA